MAAAVCALLATGAGAAVHGQVDSVTVQPGPGYQAGALHRFLLGDGYRDLWTAPIRVEILNLDSYAGGLSPLERGGGNQTRTLHLQGQDGRRYIFRSVDKFVEQVLPPDLLGTFAQGLVQDHIAALHPSGALAVPPLLHAAGVLHVVPRLFVMPDDPRLGEERSTFAGMLGSLEERPSEGPDDTPGFAGSSKVVGMERLLERLAEDPAQRPHGREYLAARLVDFLIGDTDRGTDQWRWASEAQAEGTLLWRPIPRDRDWAFVRSDGAMTRLVQAFFPKLVGFGSDYPSITALTFSSIHRDRQLLSGLSRREWDSVAIALQAALSDDVLDAAVQRLPPEHAAREASPMIAALRQRRDALPAIAEQFYHHMAREVDVHATDVADDAVVLFLADGSVEVSLATPTRPRHLASAEATLLSRPPPEPYYVRRFLPQETREVRIHLLEGADRVLVAGAGRSPIRVRVIGGPGDDALHDSTSWSGAWVGFYDAAGSNTIVARPGTRIDTRPFTAPGDAEDWVARKVARARFRDWGGGRSITPTLDLGDGVGLVFGARLSATKYGFRRVPYARRSWVEGRYAPAVGGFGFEAGAHRTRENSPWSGRLTFDGEQFDALRFHGFGNDVERVSSSGGRLVLQHRLRVTSAVELDASRATQLAAGVTARHVDPRPPAGSPLAQSRAFGATAFGTVGAWAVGQWDRPGTEARRAALGATLAAAAHPPLWDAPAWFGRANAELTAHIRFGPILAARGGAARAWGAFPVQDAVFIGGRHSLRGFRSHRFAGDAAMYGTAELRQPLGTARLLLRGDLQAHAFVDVARVYLDGASPGGWHRGVGAGLSFTTLGTTLSASYAYGEEHRAYLKLGQPW